MQVKGLCACRQQVALTTAAVCCCWGACNRVHSQQAMPALDVSRYRLEPPPQVGTQPSNVKRHQHCTATAVGSSRTPFCSAGTTVVWPAIGLLSRIPHHQHCSSSAASRLVYVSVWPWQQPLHIDQLQFAGLQIDLSLLRQPASCRRASSMTYLLGARPATTHMRSWSTS